MNHLKAVPSSAVPTNDVPPTQEVTPTEETIIIVCAWCTLLKNGAIQGKLVWPEPWSPARVFVDRDSDIYKHASHGICPECSNSFVHKSLKYR